MKRLFTIALAAMALATFLVSCKKDKKSEEEGDFVLGYWEVTSEDASLRGRADLCYAWYQYYYNEIEEAGIYSILFLPKNDIDNWKNYDYAYLCLPLSMEGKNLNLTDDLNEPFKEDFTFFAGTKTIFIGNQQYIGTMSLNVDRMDDIIIFKLDGISANGDKVKIEFTGLATAMNTPPFDYSDIFE